MTKSVEDACNQVADLVEYLIDTLIDNPDSLELMVSHQDNEILIEISCDKEDVGKIIGRRGRIIKSIRSLAHACGSRLGYVTNVEVLG